MEPVHTEHESMRKLLEKNTAVLEENNKLLRKLHRNMVIGFWVRVFWYIVLIGLPFALYFYVLEPYFEMLGSSYQEFSEGIAEIPGWKQFNLMIEAMADPETGETPPGINPVE